MKKNERGKCSILISERSDVRITSRNGGKHSWGQLWDRVTGRVIGVERSGRNWDEVLVEWHRRSDEEGKGMRAVVRLRQMPLSLRGAEKSPAGVSHAEEGHTHAHTHANASLRSHPLTLPSSYNLKAETGHLLSLSVSASSDFWRFFFFFFFCRIVEVEHSGRGVRVGGGEEFPDFQTHFLCLSSCSSL